MLIKQKIKVPDIITTPQPECNKCPCYYENNLDIDIYEDCISINKCCIITNNYKESLLRIPLNDIDSYKTAFLQKITENIEKVNIPLTENYTVCNNKRFCNNYNDTIKEICVNTQSGCNIKCKMCVCDTRFNKKLSDAYYTILNLIKNNNLDVIRLNVSGEPFLEKKKAINYILSLTQADCKNLRIITNGTLLNENDINQLTMANVNVGITVSLHSLNPETYKKIENNNFFERVLKNIDLLNKAGLLANINIVAQLDNIDEIYDFCRYFYERKIHVHLLPVRYCDEHELIINHPNLLRVKQDFPQFYGSI